MSIGEIIKIGILAVKIAIPTILFLFGANLLRIKHASWEQFLGKLVGVNDLEVSPMSFAALKVFASLLMIGALTIAYFLLIA